MNSWIDPLIEKLTAAGRHTDTDIWDTETGRNANNESVHAYLQT